MILQWQILRNYYRNFNRFLQLQPSNDVQVTSVYRFPLIFGSLPACFRRPSQDLQINAKRDLLCQRKRYSSDHTYSLITNLLNGIEPHIGQNTQGEVVGEAIGYLSLQVPEQYLIFPITLHFWRRFCLFGFHNLLQILVRPFFRKSCAKGDKVLTCSVISVVVFDRKSDVSLISSLSPSVSLLRLHLIFRLLIIEQRRRSSRDYRHPDSSLEK